jgi:acetyl-CoA carboxylase biotin carboxyl carrier protein
LDLKQIKELMVAMGRTGTKRLLIKKDNFELQLEREEAFLSVEESGVDLSDLTHRRNQTLNTGNIGISKNLGGDIPPALHSPMDAEVKRKEDSNVYITSPMVGTFYSSPAPDEPPFLKPGDKVEKDTVVCIIEAMKVMNEVKAGVAGTIVEVLVESGHPVEFKSKLFKIV